VKQQIIATILLLTVLIGTVGVVEADTEITSCQIISDPGNYRLTSDIFNSTATNCIEITADDVNLDCQGHTIDGNGTGWCGVYISRASETDSNITIKNCTVQNWTSSNVYIHNSNDNTLEDIKSLTSYTGIRLRYTKRNNITNVESSGNFQDGFYLYATYNAHLVNLSASRNDVGICFSYAAYNWLDDSNFMNNSREDMEVSANDEYWCPNYLSNVTGSGGRPIGYYYNTSHIENLDLSELILCDADNSVISNVTVHGNSALKNNGIDVLLTDNATFLDISSSYNEHGLTFKYSNNNNLSGIVAGNNRWNGIKIENSDSNTLTDSVLNSNENGSGLYLYTSSHNNISNITANQNNQNFNYGIYFQYGSGSNTVSDSVFKGNSQGIHLVQNCSYNNFTNIDASSNGFSGIYMGSDSFGSSDSNIFDNMNANLNGWYGIYMDGVSSNTIKNSYIQNNYYHGIYLTGASLGENGSNSVYNNIFINERNLHLSDDITHATSLNTTNTSGTNILGGTYMGGNYWSNSSGNGYSDTCTDSDGDGFCDNEYDLSGGAAEAIDRLPLAFRYMAGDTHCSSCAECNLKIRFAAPGSTVYLDTDISEQYGDCILIQRNSTILDCQNKTIGGDGDTYGTGIYVDAFHSTPLDNITIRNCVVSGFLNGIKLYGSATNKVTNSSISNANTSCNRNNGVKLEYSDSITMEDVVSNSNYQGSGIYASHLNSSNLTNITLNLNENNGLCIYHCDQNTMKNIEASSSNSYGFYWYYSDSNDVEGATTNSNGWDGIYYTNSDSNNFSNVISKDNGNSGIYGSYCDYNRIMNTTADSNERYGIRFYNSISNTITNSTMENNSLYGIYLRYDRLNNIYNNLFNNTNNVYLYPASYVNVWNTTPTPGPNIVGGPYIGGNYWSDYTGTDGDGDGFGEAPHDIAGGANQDHLPLVMAMCGDVDGSGNVNSMDARLLLNHVNNPGNYPVNECAGNVNGEDGIDAADVQLLLAHIFAPDANPLSCGR